MKKGEYVVRVLAGGGCQTASVAKVESVKKNVVRLVDCESLTWDARTGREIEPAIPGFYSYLVEFDGGEAERLGLK